MNSWTSLPFGQLELELPGVEPLTMRQRAEAVVEGTTDWDADAIGATLYVEDDASRSGRVARWQWVEAVREPFHTGRGFMIHGGPEAFWLYDTACQCFVGELYLAAVLCAHASCERVLAAYVDVYNATAARHLLHAGLGPVARSAHGMGVITDALLDRLLALNEVRKFVAHFKPLGDPRSLLMRLHPLSTTGVADDDYEAAVDARLRQDAELAVSAATEVVLGLGP